MYDLLIVDDEVEIREGIATEIDWETMGISNVFLAEDGTSALELCIEHRPKLIITDIRMPGFSGLELLEKLRINQIESKVLFISGFDDFKYARRAMLLKASDYLLKPIDTDEIRVAVKKMILEIEQELQEHNENWMAELPQLQSAFLDNLLNKNKYYSTEIFSKRVKQLRMEWLEYTPLVIFLVELDSNVRLPSELKEQQLQQFSINNVLSELLSSYKQSIIFSPTNFNWTIIFGLTNQKQSHYGMIAFLSALATELLDKVLKYSKAKISIGISSVINDWNELPKMLNQAKQALTYKQIIGENKVFIYDHILDLNIQAEESNINKHRLLNFIRSGNEHGVVEELKLFPNLVRSFSDQLNDSVPRLCFEWILGIHQLLEQAKLYQFSAIDSFDLWQKLDSIQNIDQLVEHTTEHFISLSRIISPSDNDIMHKVRLFISLNIRDKISLEEVANHVYITPVWLSRLFRQKMNTTFLNYVTSLKIEEAKKILMQDIHVNEVSNLLGYHDFNYFSKLFKKYTGHSPSRFKKQMLEAQG